MNGVTVGGVKYMYLQSDENQIQAKKGATGVSIAKAGKCKLRIAICLITCNMCGSSRIFMYAILNEKCVTTVI